MSKWQDIWPTTRALVSLTIQLDSRRASVNGFRRANEYDCGMLDLHPSAKYVSPHDAPSSRMPHIGEHLNRTRNSYMHEDGTHSSMIHDGHTHIVHRSVSSKHLLQSHQSYVSHTRIATWIDRCMGASGSVLVVAQVRAYEQLSSPRSSSLNCQPLTLTGLCERLSLNLD